MKKVTFSKIKITNFKGLESFESEFSNSVKINADNGKYKSTIFDAVNWCLFGKNSQNDTEFGIKNTIRTELNRADHIVELTITINGSPNVAKRVYREVWTKRRGSETTEFTGNETEYFWNQVPISQKEFQVKVSEIIEESIFRLLTSPLYFNVVLKETDRRETLVRMAGNISNDSVINGTPAYAELFAKIQGQKTLEEYRKEIAYEKLELVKKLGTRDRKGELSIRIDQELQSMPATHNWQDLENEIAQKNLSIKGIDEEINGATSGLEEQSKKIQEIQTAVFNAQREMRIIENRLKGEAENEAVKANADIRQAQYELSNVRRSIQALKEDIRDRKESIESNTKKKAELLESWHKENAVIFSFDDSKCTCYACNRAFEVSDIEKLREQQTASFNQAKQLKLSAISSNGKNLAAKIEEMAGLLAQDEIRLTELTAKETELLELSSQPLAQPKEVDLSTNADYLFQKSISEQTVQTVEIPDTTDLKEMKQTLLEGIKELEGLLSNRTSIAEKTKRIDELKAEEKKLAGELASLEKVEFTIESFNKTRMEMVEQAVDDKFKIAKFKLFRPLVNGGEEACCVTTVNGVEWSDLNTAMKINVGLDIINALSGFYGVSAPIIVDNSESIVSFLPTDSQLIRLYVEKGKELEVVNE